jgi:acetyl-CoA carboxylase carboxyltransferase component
MSALAERTMARDRSRNGRHAAAVVVEEPRTLTPYERLEALCDPGSLHVIRSTVLPRRESKRMQAGDGVVGAAGTIAGRPVYCYAQDQRFAGGSLGEAHAETIVRVMQLAGRAGAPVIGFVASGGARMDDGIAALGGYGRIFRESVKLSGRVPQISIITGVSAGGGAYSPALTDFVVMTEGSAMFLTGPGVVREVMGESVDAQELGGPRVHSKNGVCQFVTKDDL